MNVAVKGKKSLSIFTIVALFLSLLSSMGLNPTTASADAQSASSSGVPSGHLRIHYNGDITDNGLWLWGDVASSSTGWPTGATPFNSSDVDGYGAYIDVELTSNAKNIGFVVVNRKNESKDGGDKNFTITSPEVNEVWIKRGSDTVFTFEPVDLPANTVRIHYDRGDKNQSTYGLWLWEDVVNPSTGWPAGATAFTNDNVDRYGAYIDVQLKENAKKIGFVIVNRNDGDEKDGEDKGFNLLDKYNRLWIYEGDNNVYVSPYKELPTGLVSAEVLSETKLLLGFTMTDGLEPEALKNDLEITDKNGADISINEVQITGNKSVVVSASISLDNLPLNVSYSGRTVTASTGWRMLDEMYYYDGDDLGATYHNGSVTFKLWAPTATSVTASVYDKDDATQYIGNVNLTKDSYGVWVADVEPSDLNVSDLKGYFYQYQVTNNGVTKAVLDPYAKSMAVFRVNTKGETGPDGDPVGKAAIVDLTVTNPDGFDFAQIEGYEKREDAIIWEIHIRDLTSDPSIAGDLNARWGSYAAFKDKLDYVKSLGVTHVQLLPVMAWYYGDEMMMGERELEYSTRDNEYNWGYDPHNYFSPDGAYSENPADPELRVRELKELIDAVHEAGMGVVLDVVYTHMAKADFLNDIVPNYYAWQDANGNNIGGFGNNLATNHKMAEKLMVDSVKYWFEEYKIDGMRWDMMGDATYESVQNAYNAAAQINPNALFIGEGWRTFAGDTVEPDLAGQGATQDWMDKTDDVGVFSDEIRNELKSGFGSEGEPRFITGGARDINVIFNNIKAQPSNTAGDDPGDIVPYIEAHDNLPVYDVIAQSIKKDPAIPENDLEIHKRIRLGNLLVLTSQGTSFLHAGQEYGRTKQWKGAGIPEHKYHALEDETGNVFGYFVHDSYDSTDAINMFDWTKATDAEQYPVNNVTSKYTTGLIELRKSTDAFRLGDTALVNENVQLLGVPEIAQNDLVIAYKNMSTDSVSENYYVFVNADNKERKLTLRVDLTSGTVVVDNDEAGTTEVQERSGFTLTSGSITLDPLTAVVIKTVGQDKENTEIPPIGDGDNGNSGLVGSVPVNNATTDQLSKVLADLPKDDAKATEAIVAALNELASVSGVKVDGNNIASVDAAKLQTALNNLLKGIQAVEKALSGNSKLLEKVKAEASIIVKVADASGTAVTVSLSAEMLNKINQAGLAITLVTSDAAVTIPVDAVNLTGAKELQFKKWLVNGTDAESVLALAALGNKSLQPASNIFGFSVTVIDKDGNSSNVKSFNKKLNVSLQLTAQNLAAILDKKKAGAHYISDNGSTTFHGGIFNGQQISFLTDHFSQFVVLESTKSFGDIVGHWAKNDIEILAARSITDGVSADRFAPKANVTRGQMAVFLGRVLDIQEMNQGGTFTDVANGQYYTGYVNAMKQAGIMNGYEDGTFRANQDVTREEMVTMIMKAYSYATGEKVTTGSASSTFKDIGSVSSYAVDSLEAAMSLGIVNGMGSSDNFEPKSLLTRDQMAKVLVKLMETTGQF